MYVCSQYNYTPPFVIAVFLCPIIPCQIHKSEGLCEESKIGIFYLKFFFLGRVQTWCTCVTVCQQTEKWKTECDNYTEPRWKRKKEKVYFRKNKRYFKNLKSGWHGFLPIIPLTTQVNIDILYPQWPRNYLWTVVVGANLYLLFLLDIYKKISFNFSNNI